MNQIERFMSAEEPVAGDSGGCLDRIKEEPYIAVIKSLNEGRRDEVVPFGLLYLTPDRKSVVLSRGDWSST